MVDAIIGLAGDVLGQLQNAEVLAYALLNVLVLTSPELWRQKRALALGVRAAVCLVVCALTNAIFDLVIDNFIVQMLVSGAVCCMLIRDRPAAQRVVLSSIFVSSWSYSSSLIVVCSYLLDVFPVLWGVPSFPTIARLLYMVVVLALVWLLDSRVIGKGAEVSVPFAALMLAICLAGMLTEMLQYATSGDYTSVDTADTLIMCLGNQAADLVAYAMFALTVRSHADYLRAEEERHHMQMRLEALQAFRLSEQGMREMRHEVKNQYDYIRMLLKRGDYEGAERFFGEMSMQADPALSLVFSGNELVDDVVNLEIAKARAAGVEVDARIVVPAALPFEEVDLCSLLTNLLDNAIEACEVAGDGRARIELTITAEPAQGAFVISVRNPSAGELRMTPDGALASTKAEPGHGLGTRIVRRIVEKYDGVADFGRDGDVFCARVMLSMPTESASEEG